MNSERKLGLVGRVLGSLALTAILSGCAYLMPADGIRSTGGLFNPCYKDCRMEANFRESIRRFTFEEIKWVHEPDANGESGWIPSIDCPQCYPRSK